VALTTVAFAFHWNYSEHPEGRSAWPHYRYAIEALAADGDRGYDLLGHAHPRAWEGAKGWYEALGIEATPELADVFDRADLLISDNSSALYEFASLDRPVVVLNAPWYRREVEHGLRYWSMADVGVQVDEPDELANGIRIALLDQPDTAAIRRRIVAEVYGGGMDGHASDRAVEAIHSVIGAAIARRPANDGDPYAPKASVSIAGFSPRLEVHPPIPRLVYLGAPPELVKAVRDEWDGLSETDRLTAVEMFEALSDDEVRDQITDGLAELEMEAAEKVDAARGYEAGGPVASGETYVIGESVPEEFVPATPPPAATSAKVMQWVGTDADRARTYLAVEVDGQNRSTLIRKLRKVIGG